MVWEEGGGDFLTSVSVTVGTIVPLPLTAISACVPPDEDFTGVAGSVNTLVVHSGINEHHDAGNGRDALTSGEGRVAGVVAEADSGGQRRPICRPLEPAIHLQPRCASRRVLVARRRWLTR